MIVSPQFFKNNIGYLLDSIHISRFYWQLTNLPMIWHLNTCLNWCHLESHPENSGHPVRYYCRCLCLRYNCRCPCLGSNYIAFSIAAPTLWSKLLADIRNASYLGSFQNVLKTHTKLLSQINNDYRLKTFVLFINVYCLWIAPASKVHY